MHEQLVPFVPAVPFVGVPQVVYQVVDVVLLVLGIHAGLESLYLPEQGVHGHLAFGLFLLEVLDTVHLDFTNSFCSNILKSEFHMKMARQHATVVRKKTGIRMRVP